MFIYEHIQALNIKNNPMYFLKFQPRETPNLKGWSTSDTDMQHKRRQERHVKS